MTNRRVTTIEEMFNDIAAPAEKQKVDELYVTGRKGSAIIYMLRRIKSQWDKVFSRREKPSEKPTPDARFIKVTQNGKSHYELVGRADFQG